MIDHYYDKLLRLCSFNTTNTVLNTLKIDATRPLLDIIKVFQSGLLDKEYMENYVKQHG